MYYKVYGNDTRHKDTLILSSGLGGSHHYWAEHVTELSERFRVIVYDHYGTGKSLGEIPPGYSIANMAAEVIAMADETATEKFHFIGHALGGLVGLELGLYHASRVSSLMLVNAWDKTNCHTLRCFDIRKTILQASGVAAYFKAQPLFLYTAEWLKNNAELLADEEQKLIAMFSGADNLLRRIGAIEKFDISTDIEKLSVPTAIVTSTDDLLVPYSCSEHIHRSVIGSTYYKMQYGGHACNVVDPAAFNKILRHYYHF